MEFVFENILISAPELFLLCKYPTLFFFLFKSFRNCLLCGLFAAFLRG